LKISRTAFSPLLALFLAVSGCSAFFSAASSPSPSSAALSLSPTKQNSPTSSKDGVYKQYYLGLVKTPEGVEGGNGCYDDTGKFVVLINNKDAADPTFSQLVTFLQQDNTDQFPYQLQLNPNNVYYDKAENLVDIKRIQSIIDNTSQPFPPLICADFAERLHNDAEIAGIRAGYVTVDFAGQPIGHALAVFNTTDRGIVYIDDTGVDKQLSDFALGQNATTDAAVSNDKIAYLAIGKAYGLITLENAPGFGTDYSGYVSWLASQQTLQGIEKQYNDLQTQIIAVQKQIDDLTAQYNSLKVKYDQIAGGRTALPPNLYNQAMPILDQMKTVNDQRNALIDSLNGLVAQLNILVQMHNDLVKQMGPTWDSLGTVSNFYVTWDGEWR
jgi:hypothetical protein